MKTITFFLLTFLLATSVFAKSPFTDQKPFNFPEKRTTKETYTLENIASISSELNEKVGSYPPQFNNERDRKKTYKVWSNAILAAEALSEEIKDRETVLCLLSNLYRQGHNMEVLECGKKTTDVLEKALELYPNSIPVHFQASYAYLQFSTEHAPMGEKSLMKLRELLKTDRNIDVEKGLLFAYLYQKRTEDARKQAEHCLSIDPKNQFFKQVKEALKDGGEIGETQVN